MLKFMLMISSMMIMKNKTNQINMTIIMLAFNMSLQKNTNNKMSYMFMGDLISFWVTNMTLMVMFVIMFMSSKKSKMYFKMMSLTTLILTMTFYNWNFIMFYMTFEMSMIMIMMIMMSWGYQPERMEAMLFMIVMTLMFSLPLFMAMMKHYKTMNFWFIKTTSNLMMFTAFLLVFMMKMPIYFIHFWLPKVHVEAPVQGSMILAAIMLKLGCYGMMRMEKMMMKFLKTSPTLISVGLWSIIILSMNCMMQVDLKTMIAYSSIVHMAAVFTNIVILKTKSIMSSMLIIVGHGMCSASMFMMASMMYENSKSRSIMLNKGILMMMPAMSMMWFMACMTNAPMPPSLNMLGELMSLKNMVNWSKLLYPIMFTGAFTSSMYSIYMFYTTTHSNFSKTMNKIKLNTSKTSMLMMIQITPTTMIMIKPMMMSL